MEWSPEAVCRFTFDVPHKGMEAYSLFFKVKDGASYGLFTKPPVLGKVTPPPLSFGQLPFTNNGHLQFLFPLSELNPSEDVTKTFEIGF